jgi:hypothetical protein
MYLFSSHGEPGTRLRVRKAMKALLAEGATTHAGDRRKPKNKNVYVVMSGWVNAEKQIDIWKPLEII